VELLLAESKTVPFSSGLWTGQQWDWPNVWAPNVHLLHEVAGALAPEIASRWVTNVMCGWDNYAMFLEKYDGTRFGRAGGGGEYLVQ
jgi:alpha,alpha-trehalase